MPEYKCNRGSCPEILTERRFGSNVGYFCSKHGLIRAELYIDKSPAPVPEAPVEDAAETVPNADTPPDVVEETAKPKRTRKAKDSQ